MVSSIGGGGSPVIGRNSTTNMLLIIISTMALCLIVTTAQKKVNCRKFVFAPICRGVAAKRAYEPEENDIYQIQDSKPDLIDREYPLITLQDINNSNGLGITSNKKRSDKNLLKELMQQHWKIYQQQQTQLQQQRNDQETNSQQPTQLQPLELFDPTIYDYK